MKWSYALILAVMATQVEAGSNIIRVNAPVTYVAHRETHQETEYGEWTVKGEQCTAYSPVASSQTEGLSFTQTRTCTTSEERSVSQVTYYTDTHERSGAVALDHETRIGQKTDTQTAVGTKERLGCKYSTAAPAYYWNSQRSGKDHQVYWAGTLIYSRTGLSSSPGSISSSGYIYTRGDTHSSSATNQYNQKINSAICRSKAS